MIEIFQHTVSSIMAIRLTVSWGGCTKPEKELHTEHYTVNVADTAQRKGEFLVAIRNLLRKKYIKRYFKGTPVTRFSRLVDSAEALGHCLI